MKIAARTMLGVFLDEESIVKAQLNSIPQLSTGSIEIDFSGCVIDYVATSLIIDLLIQRLETQTVPRKLAIIYDSAFQERLLLKWLFLGSRELNLHRKTADDEQIRTQIIEGLKRRNITLEIFLPSENGTLRPAYTYAA